MCLIGISAGHSFSTDGVPESQSGAELPCKSKICTEAFYFIFLQQIYLLWIHDQNQVL